MEFYAKVAGVTFSNTGTNTENRQRIIAQLSRNGILEHGAELTLRRDPTNPYDSNAVAVIAPDGRQLGFLPRNVAEKASPDMARGARYKAYVAAVTGGDADSMYGINLKIVTEEVQTTPVSEKVPSKDMNKKQDMLILPDCQETVINDDFVIKNGVLMRYTGRGRDVVVPEGLQSIGDGAFEECAGLTSITLPKSLRSIGNRAFYKCKWLTSVTLPRNLRSIGDTAFWECKKLKGIILPESLQSIGRAAFYGCENLTIYASAGSYAAEYARKSCFPLITDPREFQAAAPKESSTGIAKRSAAPNLLMSKRDFVIKNGVLIQYTGSGGDVAVPESLQSIGSRAFYKCEGLTSITLPKGLHSIGNTAFCGCKGLKSITLPEGLQCIEWNAFSGCERLTSIILPKSLQSIETYAFYGCKELTSISLPEGLQSIEVGTFDGCLSLRSISLPEGLRSIENLAFHLCESLTSITLPKSLQSIGTYAFSGCEGLTSITLPESLQRIGKAAFSGCERLTSITLPKHLQSIGDEAFDGCENLTIYAPAGSYAAQYAREHDIPLITALRDFQAVALKENRTGISKGSAAPNLLMSESDFVIENGALIRYTGSGGKVVVPEGLHSIGTSSFSSCEGLTRIALPKSLKSIGAFAFSSCKGLTSIALPEGLQSIGALAFYGCERLTSITLPKSLQSIGNSAFDGCKKLTIYAPAGSYIAEYARGHGIPLITEPRNIQAVTPKERSVGISEGNANPNLLVCPDCGGTVSRRASACPHCGCPISIILEEQSN